MRLPNPIDKRLDFVRKQYGQETYEKTREIVAANLGIAEADIAPGQRVDWEKFIPWLGKQVHRILKKGPRAAPELQKLERSFQASIEPFMVKKKGRRADIARLSPKQARQFAGRQQRALGEARGEQAKKLGYKEVARLGNGYTAVVAVIDPEAKMPRHKDRLLGPLLELSGSASDELKSWVEKHASFQQWLGVELGNCLQFYKVNYTPHGASQYEVQRAGGKLYGILDPKGKPVAAILTEPDGSIRETNGQGNRPPPEKDQEYVDRFVQKHLKQDAGDTAFHPPEGFPPQVTGVIEYLLDFWPENDVRGRRRFLRKAQGYARQQGADFSKVWPRFAIYILEESKYSTLTSVKKTGHPKKTEVVAVIKRVADLYRKGGPAAQFRAAALEAARVRAAVEAAAAADAAVEAAAVTTWEAWWAVAAAVAARAAADAGARRESLAGAALEERAARAAADAALEAVEAVAGAVTAAWADYANKLLELMRDAARAAGGAQPRQGNPTSARALVKECQRLWEHYCERPGKTRLKAVVKHCEAMKKSKATTVARERQNCMKCVRAEARANKWEV